MPVSILLLGLAACAILMGRPPEPVQAVVQPTEPSPELSPPLPAPTPLPEARQGPLSGLVVYLSAGHGWVVHNLGSGWQRPEMNGIIEDVWTQEWVSRELAPALEAAGATVLAVRERDEHAVAVLSGPGDARHSGEPEWVLPSPSQPLHLACPMVEGEDTATWTLAAPEAGRWHLYTRWPSGSDRDPMASYEVHQGEGGLRFQVDQRVHGGEWWPLGVWEMAQDEELEVVLRSSGQGIAVAGEVRLGGGSLVATDPRNRRQETRRAWDLTAVHHLDSLGTPEGVWAAKGIGFRGDASARARWAAWSHPPGEEAVYISVHTDANGGRGSATYVRLHTHEDAPERVQSSWRLAELVLDGLVTEVRAESAPGWRSRGVEVDDLAELNEELQPEIPAVLIEVGFHDRADEAEKLSDPVFQEAAARGVVEGLVRWRADR